MADLSDVENTIVSAVVRALYPDGTSDVSTIGCPSRIFRGWPLPAALNSDLAAGVVNVTVVPGTSIEELSDNYFDEPTPIIPTSSLVATVRGQDVMLSGSTAGNEVVGLLVDGVPVTYRVVDGDTKESIVANLAALIRDDRAVTNSGAMLSIALCQRLAARVVMNATVAQATRRQSRQIQVICWCPSSAIRDAVCKKLDSVLAPPAFFDAGDGTKTFIRYVSTQVYDQSQNALLFRRDLTFQCEYTTITTTIAPVMLFGDLLTNEIGEFL